VVEVRVRITVPDPVMVEEPSVAVRPGVVALDRFTVPLKPFSPAMVSVTVPCCPELKARLLGEETIEKSTTLTFTRTEWESDPLVAVILTA